MQISPSLIYSTHLNHNGNSDEESSLSLGQFKTIPRSEADLSFLPGTADGLESPVGSPLLPLSGLLHFRVGGRFLKDAADEEALEWLNMRAASVSLPPTETERER